MNSRNYYIIGGHGICISFPGGQDMFDGLLPSFIPFRTQTVDTVLFNLVVCGDSEDLSAEPSRLIRDVDTGNGITRVEKLQGGGYLFHIFSVGDKLVGKVVTKADFSECRCQVYGSLSDRRFALNNTLMMLYAFSAASRQTLLVHASVVRHGDKAYAFTAKSGTGKSTQVANWICNVPDCDIINDDNPIIRLSGDEVLLYGSPWSGKTPCYRNVCVRLAAVVLIKRDSTNFVVETQPIGGFSLLLTACSSMKWDEQLFQPVCTTVSGIVERIHVVELHCLPDADSALVCKKYFEKNDGDSQ